MKNISLFCLVVFFTSCHVSAIEEIDKEVLKTKELTDTFVHDEVEEDWKTGNIENTHFEHTTDESGSIRRIQSTFITGSENVDTTFKMDYFYKNELVVFMLVKKSTREFTDTNIFEDCYYYFNNENLIKSKCIVGKPSRAKHAKTASEFSLITAKQLQKK